MNLHIHLFICLDLIKPAWRRPNLKLLDLGRAPYVL